MKFERIIAQRFLKRDRENLSRPLVNIAIYTIALGVVVMIMAVAILRGFQKKITDKVVGFGSHITIQEYRMVNDYDEKPVFFSEKEIDLVRQLPNVACVQPYCYKGGMIKTDDQIHGIIFKGVGQGFDSSFFAENITRGRLFQTGRPDSGGMVQPSNEIIISERLASKLLIDTGMKARTYFWTGSNYRARAFQVVGIYNTDLAEFDDHYIVGDISQVQRLNGWENGEVAGYEVLVDDFSKLQQTLDDVKGATRPDIAVTSIREEQPSMFAWLDLLNSNIVLILTIMAVVCAVSVVSALLIMIFEKTSMIGILKTMGATTRSIQRIFLIKAFAIVGKGLIIGNLIAFVLCLLQSTFHIVRLDTESYSMPYVPIDINIWYFIAISAGTLLVCMAALLLPSTYISHIHPAKTIRIE